MRVPLSVADVELPPVEAPANLSFVTDPRASLRHLPSVEKAAAALGPEFPVLPRPLLVAVVQRELKGLRDSVLAGGAAIDPDSVEAHLRETLEAFALSRIAPVINGTGVLIHTNLGRSPLGASVGDALRAVATGYCNVEIDLDRGERGPRAGFLETALATLCEAEAATVCNNCAAALVLILKHLATGPRDEVIISRGELVEIGGGFRVPEILEASGARLREVGTTNKTRVDDYARAIGDRTAMILKVHRSNFSMEGFVESADTESLAALARDAGLPLVEDLGSGALFPTDALAPVEHEPTPAEIIGRGVDLVCFSGDKLLGGPQAGIVAGRQDLVRGVKRDPFYRAVRPDKLILTVLQETAALYLESGTRAGGMLPDVPVVRMLAVTEEALQERADAIASRLPATESVRVSVSPSTARCGGGTMPKAAIPSRALDFEMDPGLLGRWARRLRTGTPRVVGHVEEGRFRIDLRTVDPSADAVLATRLGEVLAEFGA